MFIVGVVLLRQCDCFLKQNGLIEAESVEANNVNSSCKLLIAFEHILLEEFDQLRALPDAMLVLQKQLQNIALETGLAAMVNQDGLKISEHVVGELRNELASFCMLKVCPLELHELLSFCIVAVYARAAEVLAWLGHYFELLVETHCLVANLPH